MPRVLLFLFCLTLSSAPLAADERPRIGLVLGGGGAKGASHVGVLQVLDELNVPVDCVAGTSMGALVGATFASGRTGDDIEALIQDIDWRETVGSLGLRRDIPIENKVAGIHTGEGFEIGVKKEGLVAPGGLIPSQQIESVIRSLIGGARDTRDFDDLPIPFRAIATDLITAETVVLSEGDLTVAMRASMAAPGAFSPVVVGEQVLADGGLTKNVPIDIARELCADVVIAVWNEVPPFTPDDLSDALSLVDRSVNVMIIANELEQIKTLTDDDIGIPVQMGDISAADFLRAEEAIELGRQYALQHVDALKRYALPEDEYVAWRARLTERPKSLFVRVADISIDGAERVNPDFIRRNLRNINRSETLTEQMIADDVRRIAALGDFEQVDYELTGDAGAKALALNVREKSWGPNFLKFDFGITSNGDELLRADHTRTWINARGGRWYNTLQLGQRELAASSLYQPLDVAQTVFLELSVGIENSLEDIYNGQDRVARYDFFEDFARLDLGLNIGTRAQLRAGIVSGETEADIDTGPTALAELASTAYTRLDVRGIYDTRDNVDLPRKGSFVSIEYQTADPGLGGSLDYETIEAVFTRAFDLNGNSFSVILGGGDTLSGTPPITRQFMLGGIRTFPGLRRGELRGERYWYSGISYAQELAIIQPLFGQSLYAGLRLTAGDMQNQLDGLDEGTIYGVTGSLLGRTPIGAVVLSLSWLDSNDVRLQFSLGRPVSEGSLLDGIN
ncbi:MAG: patatin-like phospholipase family protein [Pseudomonadota bacterium]